MSNQTTLSIITAEPDKRLEALKKSRLSTIIQDQALFNRICEAAVILLNSEKLRACDESSIFGALYKAATMGFRLEPEFGECYLIPRNMNVGTYQEPKWASVCCFQIGYKGWKARALETGHIKFLEAREVYKEDEFSIEYGTNAFLKHVPAEENSGVTTRFYARCGLSSGGELFEVINKQAAEKSRRNSESQYDKKTKAFSELPKDVWLKNYAQMALRVPVKRLCAMLPLTEAVESAMQADGSVTYLQKDGALTTISPVEVEAIAEQPQETQLQIPAANANQFIEWQDAISTYSNFEEVISAYFELQRTDLYKSFPFVEMFFDAATKHAKTADDLGRFYNESVLWHKHPNLIKKLSQRKQELLKK